MSRISSSIYFPSGGGRASILIHFYPLILVVVRSSLVATTLFPSTRQEESFSVGEGKKGKREGEFNRALGYHEIASLRGGGMRYRKPGVLPSSGRGEIPPAVEAIWKRRWSV